MMFDLNDVPGRTTPEANQAIYRFHRQFLQTLQHRDGHPSRFLLKTPAHLGFLPELFETYPDALVIFTHRDPLKFIGSSANLTGVLHWMRSDDVDLSIRGPIMAAVYEILLGGAMQQRIAGAVPAEQITDVHFRTLMADPVATIEEAYAALGNLPANATYHSQAQLLTWHAQAPEQQSSTIAVVTAGTSDMAVAEEAALTAEFYGNPVLRINDVGVAGLHRLLARIDDLRSAKVLIVVAGMEGALPSVVGGLVDKPVIAVPTSVGYGAAFDGVAALLGMLTSCASGISVVNIDNGFGAGFLANRINRLQ